MDNIRDVVNKVIGGIAENKPDIHNKISAVWKNLLSKQELKHTKIDGVKENILHVTVDSPACMYQLRTRQSKILKQLKEDIPEIKNVRYKVGSIA